MISLTCPILTTGPFSSRKTKWAIGWSCNTKIMELNYWNSTECKGASYNEETGTWQVTVERKGEMIVLHPKQLVLATGMSGMPKMPDIPGAEPFKGTLIHSSRYINGQEF